MIKVRKLRLDPSQADKIPVMEIFGPTIQGEGMVVGQKTIFLRTGSCDFACSWCDSRFSWDGSEEPDYLRPEEVAEKIINLATTADGRRKCNHLTITGGNPALIGEAMGRLLELLKNEGFRFSIETQGSRYQDWFSKIDEFVLSPKPPSSGMKNSWSIFDKIIQQLEADGINHSIKIVIFDETDLDFAREVFRKYSTSKQYLSLGNDELETEEDISAYLLRKLDWLWEKILDDPDFNETKALPQLHTLVYANKRGI
ncbi:MAG: 7-carboxy-7-deazaguanine synthase QueE [Streptococcaceae bacterium]|jgi:7-carboxy-7-deazaguanine synthase|nr:7-carboxy-7-deazaguanine synthase QueE [Streptococcaceae bacterium]